MDAYTSMQEIGNLLHEAGEIHHRVSASSMEPTTIGLPGMRTGSSTSPNCQRC
jgi:hypothetical protein